MFVLLGMMNYHYMTYKLDSSLVLLSVICLCSVVLPKLFETIQNLLTFCLLVTVLHKYKQFLRLNYMYECTQ